MDRPAPSLMERLKRVRNDVPRADTKHEQNTLAAALDLLENDRSTAPVLTIPRQPAPEHAAAKEDAGQPSAPGPCAGEVAAECTRLQARLTQLRQRFEASKPVSRAVALSKLIRIRSKIQAIETRAESTAISAELDAWEREFVSPR
jgi:hypothetical protein